MSFQCLLTGKPRLFMENNPKDKRVEQQHADRCSPRKIMAQAAENHILSHVSTQQGVFMDDREMPDFRHMHQIFIDARQALADLPEHVQNRFRTARDLISFLGNDNNREEAEKLGLVRKKDPPVPSDTDRIIEALKTSPAVKTDGGQGGAR